VTWNDCPIFAELGAVRLSLLAAAATTLRLAVAVLPELLPVTVWPPATVAVQLEPVHEPLGAMVKVVLAVRSPRLLPYRSEPVAV
jgi:hypothetical protein